MPQNNTRALIEATKAEAAELIRLVAHPPQPGETIRGRIARAARGLGWTFNRTQDIWRREARRIDAHEMDQLRAFKPTTRSENTSFSGQKMARKPRKPR